MACAVLLGACDAEGPTPGSGAAAALCVEGECDDAGESRDERPSSPELSDYALDEAHDAALGCRSELDEIVVPDQLDWYRYDTPGMDLSDARDAALRFLRLDSPACIESSTHELVSYLEDTKLAAALSLTDTPTTYEDEVCELIMATHSLLIGDHLGFECESRGAAHRTSAVLWALGVAEDDELLVADYYPECHARWQQTDASAREVLECVRAGQQATMTLAAEILEFEGADEPTVVGCVDLEDERAALHSQCHDLIRDVDPSAGPGDARVTMCQAELESMIGPLFSSMRIFGAPYGEVPTCG